MTTTTELERPRPTASAQTRARLAAFAAIAAGVGLVAGHALTVDPNLPSAKYIHDLTAQHTTAIIGGLLTSVAAFLLIPAMNALLSLLPSAGAKLATAAAILIGCAGAALGAGDVMITLVMGSLVPHHRDTAVTVLHVANTQALLSLPFALAPLLVAGLVLLGVALIRGKSVPTWQAALLIIGGLLVVPSGGGGILTAALLAPLGTSLIILGHRAARRS